MQPGERAEDRQRARDVVAVADIRHAQPRQRVVRLAQRQQVGERLAGVVQVGEHVDHRDLAVLGEAFEHLVRSGAHADRGDVAREHERRVAQRLAARELQLVGAQHDGVAAELVDADLEGDARARRGLLEDQRDAAPVQRARGQRRRLQLQRAVEQRRQLAGGKLGSSQKLPWHGRASLG